MGQYEDRARQVRRGAAIQDSIIGMIALAGILVVAATAPNVVRLFQNVAPSAREPAQRFRERVAKLKKRGLVRYRFENGRYVLELTEAGRAYAERIKIGDAVIKTPKRWDGQWRMIIFDIAERRRAVRDKVRRIVADLGLYRLQDSVWVHPYDCEDIITVLKKDLKLGVELRYVVAGVIEYDEPIRRYFKL